MSDIPRPRTAHIDFSQEDVDITESDGPYLEEGDDLDVGAAVSGSDIEADVADEVEQNTDAEPGPPA